MENQKEEKPPAESEARKTAQEHEVRCLNVDGACIHRSVRKSVQASSVFIAPEDQLFMDFYCAAHEANPDGKTKLINYSEWGDKVRALVIARASKLMSAKVPEGIELLHPCLAPHPSGCACGHADLLRHFVVSIQDPYYATYGSGERHFARWSESDIVVVLARSALEAYESIRKERLNVNVVDIHEA